MNEYEFSDNKLANVQDQLEKLISRNYYLNKAAFEAYKSYLHVNFAFKYKNASRPMLLTHWKIALI